MKTKSSVIQFRVDSNFEPIWEKFRKKSLEENLNITDKIKLLIQEDVKNFKNEEDLYSVTIKVEVGEIIKSSREFYDVANHVTVKVENLELSEYSKKIIHQRVDSEELTEKLLKELNKIYFILPEFIENNKEPYRIASGNVYLAMNPYVSSKYTDRTALSSYIIDGVWKGSLYTYSYSYIKNGYPNDKLIENLKLRLIENIKNSITTTIRNFITNFEPIISIDAALEESLIAAQKLPKAKLFSLDEVCPNFYWETLSSTDHKILGKRFRGEILAQEIAELDHKDSANKLIYIKS